MTVKRGISQIIGGIVLVMGTELGIGMLALPVSTASEGFTPAAIYFIICWIFNLCTGLLLFEAFLWMPEGASFMTLTKRLLGPLGGHLFWAFYFIFFLMGMVAHVLEGGQILGILSNGAIPDWLGSIIYPMVYLPLIYLGVKSVERFSGVLLCLALITFLFFIGLSFHGVDWSLLRKTNWPQAWTALPIMMFAFTYQLIIPTLTTFMQKNAKKIRFVIIVGSGIPLVMYLIWDFLIIGMNAVKDVETLNALREDSGSAAPTFKTYIKNIGIAFSFFLPAASFATYALSFRDFLSDGMQLEKARLKKWLLCFSLLAFPILLALLYPHLFLIALRYAGGITAAVIFGLMPPLMVWIGRYQKKWERPSPQVPGGKIALSALIAFAAANILIQLITPLPTK